MVLPLLVATAFAGVTEADLGHIVRELRPGVEAELGRSMGAAPDVVIDDHAHLEAGIVARRSPDGVVDPALADRVHAELADSLAYWEPADGRLYYISDNLRAVLDGAGASPADVEPLVRCVTLHELTHAVQARSAPRDAPPLAPDVERAIREGQASVVEERGCPATMSPLAAGAAMRDLSADDGSEAAFTYVHGTVFVRALRERHGQAGVWALLEHGTVTRAEIEHVVDAVLPRPWRDATPLAARALRFHAGATDVSRVGRTPAGPLLAWLAPAVVPAVGALRADLEGPSGATGLVVIAVSDPRAAARWIAARQEAWSGGADGVPVPIPVGDVKKRSVRTPASLSGAPGVDAATLLHADRAAGSYDEAWVLVGTTLVAGWRTAPTDGRAAVAQAVLDAATTWAATPAGRLDDEAAAILDRAAGAR